MVVVTGRTLRYMERTWRLNSRAQFDRITMFWDNGYPWLVCKDLANAGGLDLASEEVRDIIAIAKRVPDAEVTETTRALLKKHTYLKCKRCEAEFFIPDAVSVRDLLAGPCSKCKDTECLAKAQFDG